MQAAELFLKVNYIEICRPHGLLLVNKGDVPVAELFISRIQDSVMW